MIKVLEKAGVFLGALAIGLLSVGCSGLKQNPDRLTDTAKEVRQDEEEKGRDTANVKDSENDFAKESTSDESIDGQVYFLSSRPDLQQQWKDISLEFEKETGIQVKITAVDKDSYGAVLSAAMQDREIPTLFDVNSLEELEQWSASCYDLKETDLYRELNKDAGHFACGKDSVLGVGYLSGSYGLIYNKKLLAEYCALDGSVISSADEITNFVVLKAVAEDIQGKKEKLGIEGAFASADVSEILERNSSLLKKEVYLKYLEQFIDMYINNSVCEPKELAQKTAEDGAVEFALGEAVFYLGGIWNYEEINGNEVADGDLGILPVYMGFDGEQNQGLCLVYRNYFCINKNASKEDVDASLVFARWLAEKKSKELAEIEQEEWNPISDAAGKLSEKQKMFWQMMNLTDRTLIDKFFDEFVP